MSRKDLPRRDRAKDAPGKPDQVIRSAWQRHGDAPFGKPFKYTDADDLSGDFAKPGSSGRYEGKRNPLRRLFAKKPPVAWAVLESSPPVTAHIVQSGHETKVSEVETKAIVPVYDDNIIIAAAENDDS